MAAQKHLMPRHLRALPPKPSTPHSSEALPRRLLTLSPAATMLTDMDLQFTLTEVLHVYMKEAYTAAAMLLAPAATALSATTALSFSDVVNATDVTNVTASATTRTRG